LGVLLYELLTGLRPYRITSSSPLEIAQVICEHEPTKPSIAVDQAKATPAAGSGSTDSPGELARGAVRLGKLRRQLEGDLDNIILKAMSKEPKRRYASAQEFSEDIRKHIEGRPVSARPATLRYRASKFVRRHKTGVTSTAIILVLLAAAVVGIARESVIARRQRARAEKRFNEVRNLANEFMFKFHDSIAGLPGTTEARNLVVSESLEYLNSLIDDASDDQSLQSELATAYFRLGDIQGMSSSGNLGDTKGALESHRKSLSLRQTLGAARPADSDLQLLLAGSYQRVGQLLRKTGDDEAGVEHYRKSIEISEALLASDPGGLPARKTLAFAQHALALAISKSDPSGALDYYKKAMAGHEAVLIEDPSDSQVRRNLSLLYKNTGAQIHSQEDMDTALTFYQKALAIDQADLAANPNDTEIRMALSFSYGSIGSALVDKGDLAGGLDNYRKALDLRLVVATADPKNAFARDGVARAYDRIGGILLRMGETNGALSSYQKMLQNAGSTKALPLEAASFAMMADSYSKLASRSDRTPRSEEGNLRDAILWYRRSLDLMTRSGAQLSAAQAREEDRISRELARCEAELDAAKKPPHTH
jgi:non-specific serine/threonine protein kinase/serine/threonine-protein kinase